MDDYLVKPVQISELERTRIGTEASRSKALELEA